MKRGDIVRVYPHGSPELGAQGTVYLISDNQRSIAVMFQHIPPFAVRAPAVGVSPWGVAFLAYRVEIDGKPWGPWIELFGNGHYEIEEIKPS